jgi:hypothetical protein
VPEYGALPCFFAGFASRKPPRARAFAMKRGAIAAEIFRQPVIAVPPPA